MRGIMAGIVILVILVIVLCRFHGFQEEGYCCPYCGKCYDNEKDCLDCIARDEYDIDNDIW